MRHLVLLPLLALAAPAASQGLDPGRFYDPRATIQDGGSGPPRGSGGNGYRRWSGASTLTYGSGVAPSAILAEARTHPAVRAGIDAMLARGYVRRPEHDLVHANRMTGMYLSLGFEKPGRGPFEEQPILVVAQRPIGDFEAMQVYGALIGAAEADGDTIPVLVERPGDEPFYLQGGMVPKHGASTAMGPDLPDDGGGCYARADHVTASPPSDWEWQLQMLSNPQFQAEYSYALAVGALAGGIAAVRNGRIGPPSYMAAELGIGAFGGMLAAHVSYWAMKRAQSGPAPLHALTGAEEATWGAIKARWR